MRKNAIQYNDIVEFLGSFGGDVSRATIAQGLGVPADAKLSMRLRAATKAGAIVRTGLKRGAKYNLPPIDAEVGDVEVTS